MERVGAVVAACCGLGAAVFGAVSLGLNQATDPSFGLNARQMRTIADEWKQAPLVLPVTLPDGYGWAGVGEQQGDGQVVWARVSHFASASGGPLVELCAKASEQERGCEQDGDTLIVRDWNGLQVSINVETSSGPAASPELLTFWQNVELTRDYESVRWLPN